jgi:tetratricopeptide (TPR) repeat protein
MLKINNDSEGFRPFAILFLMLERLLLTENFREDAMRRARWRHWMKVAVIAVGMASAGICAGQTKARPAKQSGKVEQSVESSGELQQQYDAAQRAQSAGDMTRASQEYRRFLLGSLRRLAEGRFQIGDYPGAARLFEEALALGEPDENDELRLRFAEAALQAHDSVKAKALAEAVLVNDPKSAEARWIAGEALLQGNENEQARKQLEAAVALDPSYKNGLALATAYLALADTKDAETLFEEMSKGFGDKADMHLDFGRAYGEAGYPDKAIVEFEKAIARDETLPEAHYGLGASYMLSQGEVGYPRAIKEFDRELALHPDDYFSLAQLGNIALTQHRLEDAESYLKRASILDPRNPDNPLLLGQVYLQMKKLPEAEQAFHKAIELTTDLSRNHYQVQRAHYLLGRVLLQMGRADEAKGEMQISADLLKQNLQLDQARLKGSPMGEGAGAPPLRGQTERVVFDAKAEKEMKELTSRVSGALADSYNNLGAIAAGNNEFATATGYFEKAARWNPSLDGLDYNWGRAAFSGKLYAQAIPPLTRYLAAHPEEQGARNVLGVSLFMQKDYAATIATLQPLEASLVNNLQLAYIYAQALVQTGDYAHGLVRLQALSKANPGVAEIHRALGEAYAAQGNYQQATDELRSAIQLNAEDKEAKDQLALALTHLEKSGESVHP